MARKLQPPPGRDDPFIYNEIKDRSGRVIRRKIVGLTKPWIAYFNRLASTAVAGEDLSLFSTLIQGRTKPDVAQPALESELRGLGRVRPADTGRAELLGLLGLLLRGLRDGPGADDLLLALGPALARQRPGSGIEHLVGTHAARANNPAAAYPDGSTYAETDRKVAYRVVSAAWVYFSGIMRDTLANRPADLGADDAKFAFVATDTFEVFYWDGAAWQEVLLPALVQIFGTTSSFPAIKRDGAGAVMRLADDSADTFIKVLDEAYDATNWNGKTEVPTKNAVRDKIETVTGGESAALVSDAVYGAGWDAVVTIAPSKNAVYDKIQTLLGSSAYTPTNVTTDRSFDADTVVIAELADVVGTLIADLQAKGILS